MAMEISKVPPANRDRDQRPNVPRRRPAATRRPPAATEAADKSEPKDDAAAGPGEHRIDVQA